MGQPGRPPLGLDDYLEWQQKLSTQKESGVSVQEFCRQEGCSRAWFYKWVHRLKDGISEEILDGEAHRDQDNADESLFLPVALQTAPIEIELPNGSVLRLPLGIDHSFLLEVIQMTSTLPGRRTRT